MSLDGVDLGTYVPGWCGFKNPCPQVVWIKEPMSPGGVDLRTHVPEWYGFKNLGPIMVWI